MTSKEIKTNSPPSIELFRTEQYYIFVNGEHSLWWDRRTGELTAKTGASADNLRCVSDLNTP